MKGVYVREYGAKSAANVKMEFENMKFSNIGGTNVRAAL